MPHSIANHHKKSHLNTADLNNMGHLQNNNNNNNDSGGGIFNNVEHLSRGGGEVTINSNNPNSNSNSNSNGSAQHEKESSEQNIYYYDVETLAGQSLRDITGGADNSNSGNDVGGGSSTTTSGLHGKSNFAPPPTPRPNTPPPTPPPVYIPSLRDAHTSSSNNKNGDPSNGHTAVHSKYSKEQNAQNPEDKPEGWSPPEPEPEDEDVNEEDETTQIERVQGATPNYSSTHNSECKSSSTNGQFFNHGQTNSRNGGVVLRYQYELVQQVGEGSLLTVGPPGMKVGEALEYDVLPRLEGFVSDLLIPVFFEECRNNNEVRGRSRERRGLGVVENDGGNVWSQSQGGLRHHNRRLNKVVGIDAKPDDFALTQAECTLHSPSPYKITQCHRVEGALTLYFPPNYSLSTILAAAKLSALQAIQQGMNDGSLATSHEDIKKLYFLESSFSLQHDVLDNGSGDGDESIGVLDDGGKNTGKIIGIVLGILLPLLICCCGFGFFFWKKRQQQANNELEEEDGDSSSDSSESTTNYKRRAQRDSRRDEQERQLRSGNTSSRHGHNGGSDGESEYDGETDAMHTEDEESQVYTEDEESQYDTGATTTSASASEYDTGATTTSASECYDEDDASSQSSISVGAPPSRPAAAQYVEYMSDSDKDGTSEEEGSSTSASSSSSSSSSEEQDHFPMPNPLEPIFEEVERERQKKKKAKKRQARMRRRYERMQKKANKNKRDVNSNIVMTGSHDDNLSVMTGATGATGLHSLASQRTARVRNKNVGVGDDNRSVMTGATGMTQRVSNTNPYVREELD